MKINFKKYNEFINESISSKLSKWHLENSIDGQCGIFAYTYKKINPKSEIFGILDISYKPKPTIQHYFVKDGKEFFDGSGIKTLKEFEKQYRGTSIKVNDSGVEDGKDEDDYSDLPDFGFDNQYAQIMNKK